MFAAVHLHQEYAPGTRSSEILRDYVATTKLLLEAGCDTSLRTIEGETLKALVGRTVQSKRQELVDIEVTASPARRRDLMEHPCHVKGITIHAGVKEALDHIEEIAALVRVHALV